MVVSVVDAPTGAMGMTSMHSAKPVGPISGATPSGPPSIAQYIGRT